MTALYQKYRPKSLDDIVGQKHIIATLKQANASNKFSHAYLFVGSDGVGRSSVRQDYYS